MERSIELLATESGLRLDKYLAAQVEGLSRSAAQKLIKAGRITVNGQPVKPSYLLEEGDAISVRLPPPESTEHVQ